MSLVNKNLVLVLLLVGITAKATGQFISLDEEGPKKKFPYLSLVYDRIFNISHLDSFYAKLQQLRKNKKGKVSILHIGDSHVEAGFYPKTVKDGLEKFFGSAGKDSAGIDYRSIGVIGARFETFNHSASFWEKIRSHKTDLYIISLGTNDAQGSFNEPAFLQQVGQLYDSLQKIDPGSKILFTTVADSFLKHYPNRFMWTMNISLYTWCVEHNIPVWDLYRTTNGYGSAYNWIKAGMMNKDGVHYTAKGYQLQGQLLFNALARGYNDYVGSY